MKLSVFQPTEIVSVGLENMFNLQMCNGLEILQVHLEKQLCNLWCVSALVLNIKKGPCLDPMFVFFLSVSSSIITTYMPKDQVQL